ncbi:MAG: undecaprenyl-diphosphatase UppP [candidate division Zixibacteria bacterium RBG_16_48_11]|nr:MAG: undecaprenyl-diphosphatase UppP [candidate division Zixibacteria bacterium RBG_16_48_11]
MTLLQALILGLVQGATEFIPVSSSAHLVLVPYLFDWKLDPQIAFAYDVLVHWGTLVAVVFYFRKDLWAYLSSATKGIFSGRPLYNLESKLAWLLVAGTIPAAIIGYLFADFFEQMFSRPLPASLFLFGTALLLTWSERQAKTGRPLESLDFWDALVIGSAQAVAIFPGISRSGATISAGLFRGIDKVAAARFSFLLSVPIIFGAGLLPLKDLLQMKQFSANLPLLLTGFLSALVSGYLCIDFLLKFLQRRKLYVFAGYCVIFAVVNLLKLGLR